MQTSTTKIKKIIVTIFWIGVWQAISMLVGEDLVLPSPILCIPRIFSMLMEKSFYRGLFSSTIRIAIGFIIGSVMGILFAIFSYTSKNARNFISPMIQFIKAVPVASFVLIALFIMNSSRVSILISLLIVLPIFYSNVYEALTNIDKNYLELADVFEVGIKKRIYYIYLPQLSTYIYSAASVGIGIAWKSGLAAEVIAGPKIGLGRLIHDSKIYLNSVDLISYTILAVIFSYLFEKILLLAMRRYYEN